MRRALACALLAALAPVALAQGVPFGVGIGHQASKQAWGPTDLTDVQIVWDTSSDAKTAGFVQVGGVDLAPADDDYFARTSGALPGVTAGTPDYPLSVVIWFKLDKTTANAVLWSWDDGLTTNRLVCYVKNSNEAAALATATTGAEAVTAASVVDGRWHVAIFVFSAADARAVYLDLDTTGGTDATSKSPTGLDEIYAGRDAAGLTEVDGEIGPIWVLSGDLSGAGQAANRDLIFAGCNPATVTGFPTLAYYPMETAAGTDASGNGFGLTPSGTPAATNRFLAVRNKLSASSPYVARATTSPPQWDATAFNNLGGADFTSASSQFLVCETTPITAAPFQVYCVAESDNTTNEQVVCAIADTASSNNYWQLWFAGTVGGDPIRWTAYGGAVSGGAPTTTGYSAATTHLLWGQETSATSRAAEIDGGSQGTNGVNVSPAGVDAISVGARLTTTLNSPLYGRIGLITIQSTASTVDQADMEAYTTSRYGAP